MNTFNQNASSNGSAVFERTNTLRAVVYSRVSTDAQEKEGTSLDTQERASREYVDANGWTLVVNGG